ncbi:hypothetical protein GCM10007939_17160 [Amylibacter marinus]|uniref:Capsular polysaccharide export protein n=1 Tax=Amylibacter marinus TaxID=1475483 RepID=A0ABQ5VVX3_9RHOB|nr:capsular biosynthesis protein [Amylibacter marinus]GLQ35433.1 hypothetical protein GCM10007939_17160 [Amylibacter marinus]
MAEVFCVYNESKASKRRALEAVSAVGSARIRRMPFLSFTPYPETNARAELALSSATKPAKNPLLRALKRKVLQWQYNGARRYFSAHRGQTALSWNGLKGSRRAFMMGAQDAGARCLYVEHAPLPGKLSLDRQGLNYTNSLPRNADFYIRWAKEHRGTIDLHWRKAKQNITARKARAGYQSGLTDTLSKDERFVFIPLQVPSDTQIRVFGGWVQSVENMLDVLARSAAHLPEGWHLRIKEHPSSDVSFGVMLREMAENSHGRIRVDNQTDTFEQVEKSGAVLTINSSVGLEAMFFEKPVITLGQAFYGFSPLVHCADSAQSLADLLASVAQLKTDPTLRSAYLNYLLNEYYPDWAPDAAGKWHLNHNIVLKRLAE